MDECKYKVPWLDCPDLIHSKAVVYLFILLICFSLKKRTTIMVFVKDTVCLFSFQRERHLSTLFAYIMMAILFFTYFIMP